MLPKRAVFNKKRFKWCNEVRIFRFKPNNLAGHTFMQNKFDGINEQTNIVRCTYGNI